MAYPATNPYPARPAPVEESGAGFKVATLLLGFLVGVLAIVAFLFWATAEEARQDAAASGEAAPAVAREHAAAAATATPSFAGAKPADAEAIAAAHTPYPAELPALQPGPVAHVDLAFEHKVVEVAPGVKYQTWTIGDTAPGPVIHVREGQLVKVRLTNDSPMPHSLDFHAARIAPNVAFADVAPGESFEFEFVAGDPGVYMYHCGTKPVLAHIANGMYGAIVVQPGEKPLPRADREYVLVSSEWYLNGDGLAEPAGLDMGKARAMQPDWATFNGYAGQYVTHPLGAEPGETVRLWVVAAGPTLDTDFHVVGTVFDRAWVNADVTSDPQTGVQTVLVPAGGGGVFDVTIHEPGLYPFVSHAFAHVELGQVGLLKVGDPDGSASH